MSTPAAYPVTDLGASDREVSLGTRSPLSCRPFLVSSFPFSLLPTPPLPPSLPPSLPPLLASSISSYLLPFVVAAAQEKGDAESKKREAEEASAKYAENRCVLAAQERENPCIDYFARFEMHTRGQVHCHAIYWPGHALMEEATISDDQEATKINK